MRRYRFMMAAFAAAVLMSACSKKSDDSTAESVRETAPIETQTREAEIEIVKETTKAVEPETSAPETTGSAEKETQESKTVRETAAETKAVKETEAPKVYAVSAFEETMYATRSVNVRASYTTKSEVLTCLSPSQKVKVTGKSANGWMRVIYDGRDAYVYQNYLTENPPKRAEAATQITTPQYPEQEVSVYPGSSAQDPVTAPGEVPVVEPSPVTGAPDQTGSLSDYGPGMYLPGGMGSQTESPSPGGGPGV